MKTSSLKNVSLFVNVLLLATVVVMAYHYHNIQVRSATMDSATLTDSTLCYDCSDITFGGLTKKEFYEGLLRYKGTHWNVVNPEYINSALGRSTGASSFADARSCWYSFDTLLHYMCLIKYYSACMKIPVTDLGIRFYYAVYNNDAKYGDYQSHHTLFMIPTYVDKNNDTTDFDPRLSCDSNRIILPNKVGGNVSLFILDPSSGSTAMAQNQGKLCPPHCTGSTTLSYADGSYTSDHHIDASGLGFGESGYR